MKPLKILKARVWIALSLATAIGVSSCGSPFGGKAPAAVKRRLLPAFEREFNGKFADLSKTSCEYTLAKDEFTQAGAIDQYYYFNMLAMDVFQEVQAQLANYRMHPSAYTIELQSLADHTGVIIDFTKGDAEKGEVIKLEDRAVLTLFGEKKIHIIYLANSNTIEQLKEFRSRVANLSNLNIVASN